MTARVGTSGYSYPKWKGRFYPAELPARQFLRFYAAHFRAVEINASFYKLPAAATLERWAAEVPADFHFALKAPQAITHIRRLKDAAAPLAGFLDAAAVLKDRLGPLLFQLPPNFKLDLPRLRAFLDLLPAGTRAAFEFRHASWFDDAVYTLLRERGVALCWADETDDLPPPPVATAGWVYARLRRPDYDAAALTAWAGRLAARPWGERYVFFKHEDTGTGPRFAARLLDVLAPSAKLAA